MKSNTDNFGMKPLLEPSGDGVQYFKIRVSAYDAGNKSTSRNLRCLDNRAPRIVDFAAVPVPPTMPYEVEASTGYLKTIRIASCQNPPFRIVLSLMRRFQNRCRRVLVKNTR